MRLKNCCAAAAVVPRVEKEIPRNGRRPIVETTKGQQVVSALEGKSTCAEIALAWVEAADCEIMSC